MTNIKRISLDRILTSEAFSHNPTDVTSIHLPIGKDNHQMSELAVPLVLS